MSPVPVNLLVFREERGCVPGDGLKTALLGAMESRGPEAKLRALLRAGELECGVADAAPELAQKWELVTDRAADALVAPELHELKASLNLVGQARVPHDLEISKPEGFAYYALHPLAYADVLDRFGPLPATVGVIGLRSIGTTLSAVTGAALRCRGVNVSRVTVRPQGHPYNRKTVLSPPQSLWLRELLERNARLLIVDEGPGLSGSSFLSVAEALVEQGAPSERITLICGHEPDFPRLCSEDGPQRARRFRWVGADNRPRVPQGAEVFAGGGEWRRWSFSDEEDWPATWTSMERLKYLSHEDSHESRLFKFLGFGHYGDEVIERERALAAAGFAPQVARAESGFVCYPWLRGRPMRVEDLCESVLARLAEYCAFRASGFPAGAPDLGPLQQMAEHNLDQSGLDLPANLQLERGLIADGRMQPHEWLLTKDGRMLKTDCGSHGDDHFFPGPTDVAWDLAGAMVEWRMDRGQSEFFLDNYCRASGDDVGMRISDFLIAYAAFRSGYCLMAANATAVSHEQQRLDRAASDYLRLLSSLVGEGHGVPLRTVLESPAA
ncbi:MAG TPA: hypothetical protein VF532_04825 [Candidatus Angelobacter sp.]